MIEIKEITDPTEIELEQLAKIYYDAFKTTVGLDEEICIPESECEILTMAYSKNEVLLTAYKNGRIVGFTSYTIIPEEFYMIFESAIEFRDGHCKARDLIEPANRSYALAPGHKDLPEAQENDFELYDGEQPIVESIHGYDMCKLVTAVTQEEKRNGVGRQMQVCLSEHVKENTEAASIFTVCVETSGMVVINQKFGYERIMKIKGWYGGGTAAVLMGKKIDRS